MSSYQKLVEEFFLKYEIPELDELTVGFSGIDPPLKVNAAEADHEKLDGLLGGDFEGHYHLTKELWLEVMALLDDRYYDGGFASTTENEYMLNVDYWLDGGNAGTQEEEYSEAE